MEFICGIQVDTPRWPGLVNAFVNLMAMDWLKLKHLWNRYIHYNHYMWFLHWIHRNLYTHCDLNYTTATHKQMAPEVKPCIILLLLIICLKYWLSRNFWLITGKNYAFFPGINYLIAYLEWQPISIINFN